MKDFYGMQHCTFFKMYLWVVYLAFTNLKIINLAKF